MLKTVVKELKGDVSTSSLGLLSSRRRSWGEEISRHALLQFGELEVRMRPRHWRRIWVFKVTLVLVKRSLLHLLFFLLLFYRILLLRLFFHFIYFLISFCIGGASGFYYILVQRCCLFEGLLPCVLAAMYYTCMSIETQFSLMNIILYGKFILLVIHSDAINILAQVNLSH